MNGTSRTPVWVWLAILGFALVEPVTHAVLRIDWGGTHVGTGLHIEDDSGFLPAVAMFETGFFSPYVTYAHPHGPHDPAIFGAPVFWLLALFGYPLLQLGLDPLLALGVMNGLGLAAFLWAVYRFLRTALPQAADRAYQLFLLSGGLAGALYLGARLFGMIEAPGFEVFFHRYARYELIEGPFLAPLLIANRVYYTAPLGLGFAALTLALRRLEDTRLRAHALPALLLLAASYWNARLGPLFWFALMCRALAEPRFAWRDMLRLAMAYAVPACAAVVLVSMQMRLNPVTQAATFGLLRRSIWFGSFLSVAGVTLLAASPALRRGLRASHGVGRVAAFASVGYLAVFAIGYAAYQTYWGNWLAGGDAAAALAVSDTALLGAVAGAVAALRWRAPVQTCADPAAAWFTLWFVALAAAGVAALGGGRYLAAMPERCLVLMGVPLAGLAALGIRDWSERVPVVGRGFRIVLHGLGACSLCAYLLFFNAPAGYTPGHGPFAWLRVDVMSRNEAALLGQVESGVVLAPATAPPQYGDIAVAFRPGVRTVFGQGTFAIGDVDMAQQAGAVSRFFDPAASEEERRAALDHWCVDYVLCPETRPVDAGALAGLESMAVLEVAAKAGNAVLFRVRERTGTN